MDGRRRSRRMGEQASGGGAPYESEVSTNYGVWWGNPLIAVSSAPHDTWDTNGMARDSGVARVRPVPTSARGIHQQAATTRKTKGEQAPYQAEGGESPPPGVRKRTSRREHFTQPSARDGPRGGRRGRRPRRSGTGERREEGRSDRQKVSSEYTSSADSLFFPALLAPPHFGGPRRPHIRYPGGGSRRPQEVQEGAQEASGSSQEATGGPRRLPYQCYYTSGVDSFFPKQLAERGAVVVEANSGRGKAKQRHPQQNLVVRAVSPETSSQLSFLSCPGLGVSPETSSQIGAPRCRARGGPARFA